MHALCCNICIFVHMQQYIHVYFYLYLKTQTHSLTFIMKRLCRLEFA